MDCSPPDSSVQEDSPGKNTGVSCHALFQGIFPTQGRTQVSCMAGGFFTNWATREAQEYWSSWPTRSPGDLPGPGLGLGSLALQADSPAELPGKHPASGYFSIRRGCCWDSVGSPRQSTWRSEQEGEGQGPHHQRPAHVFEAPGEEPGYRTLNIGAQSALIPPSLLWGPGQSSAWEQDTEALVSTPHRLWACARDSVCLRAWISGAGCCGA